MFINFSQAKRAALLHIRQPFREQRGPAFVTFLKDLASVPPCHIIVQWREIASIELNCSVKDTLRFLQDIFFFLLLNALFNV